MALATQALKDAIKDAFQSEAVRNQPNADLATTELAGLLADAIETFVKSGTVDFTSGEVTGTCPSGGGPLTLGTASGGEIS